MKTKNQISVVALALSLLVLLTAGAAAAASQSGAPAAASKSSLTGEVVAASATALVVRTEAGEATVTLSAKTSRPADLKAGDRVVVDFARSAKGARLATRVRSLRASPSAASPHVMSGAELMAHAAANDSPQAAPATQATGPARHQSGDNLTGDLVSLRKGTLVVRTAAGQETVVRTSQTVLPKDLKIGDRVVVDLLHDAQGKRVATAVRLQQP